jgi:hypothetical protein
MHSKTPIHHHWQKKKSLHFATIPCIFQIKKKNIFFLKFYTMLWSNTSKAQQKNIL